MTVAEFIIELSRYPGDLPVYVADWNEEYAPPTIAAIKNEAGQKKHFRNRDIWLPNRVEITAAGTH